MNREILTSLEVIEERLAAHLAQPGAAAVSMRLPLLHDYRVAENIALGRIVRWQQPGDRAEQLARHALDKHGLVQLADRFPGELSRRELFTVMLLRAVSIPRRCLLLDCPTTDFGLDEGELPGIVAPHAAEFLALHILELDTGGRLNRSVNAFDAIATLPGAEPKSTVGGEV